MGWWHWLSSLGWCCRVKVGGAGVAMCSRSSSPPLVPRLAESAAPAKPAAAKPRPPAATKSKTLASKKPVGKPGLGVKKMAVKVDDSLFDQKPAEPPLVVTGSNTVRGTAAAEGLAGCRGWTAAA
jgi:hypothetical protein